MGSPLGFGSKAFFQLMAVFADHRVGGLEDGLCGAVVLLQFDHFGLGIVSLEVQDVRDIRQAEAVDGLPVVTYHAQIAVPVGKQANEYVLSVVGILVFVHHDVAESLTVLLKHRRMLPKEADRQIEQIIKVDGIDLLQTASVDIVSWA